ncbi:DNA-methyltransferase [Candidatus Poriferisodalis sp.]|uniref:DNA-methyltransferase n=1 Tax=Candidatus Poriferisodalis sp. TaxID=3101277 RepID=UPI003B0268A8
MSQPASLGPRQGPAKGYATPNGLMLTSTIEEALSSQQMQQVKGKIDLILTSPPFPLNRKKSYGNLTGSEYVNWLRKLAPPLTRLLAPNGSIVLEIGNAWEPGKPAMSTLPLKALLEFQEAANLHLCQQFVGHNPARLPGPAQWVTIKRVRVKDSFTNIWWLSKTPHPKADNRRVLRPYSESMKRLLKRRDYNRSTRPSGHNISGDTFLADNGGAIPSNVLEYANTQSTDPYRQYCIDNDLPIHPARMQLGIIQFFVEFLTEPGDLVLDPFGGSNSTGAVAEDLGRRWLTVEPNADYVAGSIGRFTQHSLLNHSAQAYHPRTAPNLAHS